MKLGAGVALVCLAVAVVWYVTKHEASLSPPPIPGHPAEERSESPVVAQESGSVPDLSDPSHETKADELGQPQEDKNSAARPPLPVDPFSQKYAGKSRNELLEAKYALENSMQASAAKEIASRRAKGQYQRVVMERAGGVPMPPEIQGIPLSDRWTQTILNPPEELTADRRAEDPMPVWWIVLTRKEYPELFAQRDEVEWLRYHTR